MNDLEFSRPPEGRPRCFIKGSGRHKNLATAKLLESSAFSDDDTILTVISRLRWCSQSCVLAESFDNFAEIAMLSKKCRSAFCYICNKIKSSKLASRLMTAIEQNPDLFDGKYFYFLTLTVRHTATVRPGNYLPAFRQYITKFFRSNLIKNYFVGWVNSIECTIGANGYHIHSHTLLVGERIKDRIQAVQAEFLKIWGKLTDTGNADENSTQIKFDLVRPKNPTKSAAKVDEFSKENNNLNSNCTTETVDPQPITSNFEYLRGSIMELCKYALKSGSLAKMTAVETNLFAEWIRSTKGKNFFNTSGIFRGLQVFSCKSDLDEKPQTWEVKEAEYYIGQTSKVWYNRNPQVEYSGAKRRKILEKVCILAAQNFERITDVAENAPEIVRSVGGTGDRRDDYAFAVALETAPRSAYERSLQRAISLFRRPTFAVVAPTFDAPDRMQLTLNFEEIERLAAVRNSTFSLTRDALRDAAQTAFSEDE
jgi:hypothetical protein